jgi:hypothetical protein
MRSIVRLVAALVPALLLTTACTSVIGVNDVPNATCGGATASNDCGHCMFTSCCDAWVTCESSSCGDLLTCFEGCASGDTTCESACETAYPDGVNDADVLAQCAQQQCPSACGTGG